MFILTGCTHFNRYDDSRTGFFYPPSGCIKYLPVFDDDFFKSETYINNVCEQVSIIETGMMKGIIVSWGDDTAEVAKLRFSFGDYYARTQFLKKYGEIKYLGYEKFTERIRSILVSIWGFIKFIAILILICWILSLFGGEGGGTWSGGGTTSSGGSWSGRGTFK
ncbi:MAG: hypothetical protein AAB394_01315 [Patescibacteria group bacterium]